MKIRFVQDISLGVGGELSGWHRVGEVLETGDSRAQWLIDNGWAVAIEEDAQPEAEVAAPAETEVTDDATGETLLVPESPAEDQPSVSKRKAKK